MASERTESIQVNDDLTYQPNQLESLFSEAIELPESRRNQFLQEACGDNHALLGHLMNLVTEYEADLAHEVDHGDGGFGNNPSPPRTIGPYTIVKELGHGGMGSVYLAIQDSPRREVAIKVIRPVATTRSSERRFANEAQLMAMLHHPNIADVYEHGVFVDELGTHRHYIAMEYVRGESLHDYLAHADLSLRDRVRLVARICGAVGYAHKRGVVHRDIKPANIITVDAGQHHGEDVPVDFRIVDFGVGTSYVAEQPIQTTHVGVIVGSFPYISPEAVSGTGMMDSRADIYSLGVMAYEIITGKYPIEADWRRLSAIEGARLILEHDAVPARKLRTDIDSDLEAVLLRAVEREPQRRYTSADEMQDDLRRYLQNIPVLATPLTAWRILVKGYQRNRTAARVLVALLVCVAAAGSSSVYAILVARERAEVRSAAVGERLSRRQAEIVAVGLASASQSGELSKLSANSDDVLESSMREQVLSIVNDGNWAVEERVRLLNTAIWVGVASGATGGAAEARRLASSLLSEGRLGNTSVEAEYLVFAAWHEHRCGEGDRARRLLQTAWDLIKAGESPDGESACIASIVECEIELDARNYERAGEFALAAGRYVSARGHYPVPKSELIRALKLRCLDGVERSKSEVRNGS